MKNTNTYKICSIEGCGKEHSAKGLCSYHYKLGFRKPWENSYYHAKNRCNNPRNHKYHIYGARGIKFLLTKDNFQYLWDRDKAYLLKWASIDRINSDGNYELSNCRFIEFNENDRGKARTRKP